MAEGSEKIILEVIAEKALSTMKKVGESLFGIGKNAQLSGEEIDKMVSLTIKGVNLESKSVKELNAMLEKHRKVAGLALSTGKHDKDYNRLKLEIIDIESALNKKKKAENEAAQATLKDVQSIGSLRKQLKSMTLELAQVSIAYENLSEAEKNSAKGDALLRRMQNITKEAGTLRDSLDDATQAIKNQASDTSTFDAISQGLNVAASAAGAYVGVLGMLGASEEEQQAIQTKLQASLAISNALSVVQNALQKQSALMIGITTMQEKAALAARLVVIAAKGKDVVVTKAATVAQAAFNAVAKANPYVLLATALITVVGAITAFALGTKKAKDVTEAQNKELERQQSYMQDFGNAAGKAHAKYMLLVSAYSKLKSTAEKTDFIKKNADAFTELGLRVQNLTDAENVLRKNTQQVIASFAARAQAAAAASAIEKAYTDYYNNLQELNKGEEMTKTVFASRNRNDYNANQQATIDNQEKEAKAYIEQRKKAIQDELDKAVKFYQKAFEDANNELSKFNFLDDGKGGATTTKTDNSDKIKALQDYIAKARYTAEMGAKDAQVKAMQDGEAKVLAQMAQDHKKELDEIDRNKAEYVAKQKELAGLQGTSYNESEDPTIKNFLTQIDEVNKAYEASTNKIKAQTQTAINEFLAENGTYVEQINAIMALYEEKMQGKNEGEKMQLLAEMQAKIEDIRSKFGVASQAFGDMFADMADKSTKEIQRVIDKYELLLTFIEQGGATNGAKTAIQSNGNKGNVTAEDLKNAGFTDAELELVKQGKINVDELREAIKRLKDENGGLTKSFKDAYKDISSGNIAGGIQKLASAANETLGAIQDIGNELSDAFGGNADDLNNVIKGLQGVTQAGAGVGQIMSGDVVGGALNVAKGVANVVSSIAGLGDAKHEKRIQKLQERIDALGKAYKDLEEVGEKAFGSDKVTNYKDKIANLEEQIKATEGQIAEEQDKKKTDNGKIDAWRKNIDDMQHEIRKLKEGQIDAIVGEDIMSSIEKFADAYVSAWDSGISRAKTAKEQVKRLMQQTVTIAIQQAISTSKSMEKIRESLVSYMQDGILSAVEQNNLENMAEALQKELETKFGWASKILKGGSSDGGTSGGFATASQDSVDELNGRFTAVQMSTASIEKTLQGINEQIAIQANNIAAVRENTEQAVNLAFESVDYLSKIEKHTSNLSEMNERLGRIEQNTSRL